MDLLTFLLSFIPGVVLRYFFPESKLAEKIEISVCDDRRGIFINGGDIPSVEVNLKITNLTPFEITIERLWCETQFVGGTIGLLESTLWQTIEARTSKSIHLRSTITAPQRDFVRRISPGDLEKYRSDRQFRIGLEGELSCRVRRIQIFGRELTTTNLEIVNFRETNFDD